MRLRKRLDQWAEEYLTTRWIDRETWRRLRVRCNRRGLVIPIIGPDGNRTGVLLTRLRNPFTGRDGKVIKCLWPEGCGAVAHFTPPAVESLSNPNIPPIICESWAKAEAVARWGFAAVGINGCDGGFSKGKILPELAALPLRGRTVGILFDSNTATNERVKKARTKLAKAFRQLGANVVLIDLPHGPGNREWGIDDAAAHDADAAAALIQQTLDADGIATIDLATLEARKTEWLWPGRIPWGALTGIDGDPGQGKSQITIDLAARVTRGWPMPPDLRRCETREPGTVGILSAEDDSKRTILPRLVAAGADLDRVFVVDHVGKAERPFTLPNDITKLEKLINEKEAKLVIFDPVMAFIGTEHDAHVDSNIRHILGPLSRMVERTGAAVILLRHLNKKPGGSAMYRGGGSIAFTASCRSCLMVGSDPQDEKIKVLAQVKSNLGPMAQSLTYSIQPVANEYGGTSRIKWGKPTELKADQIIDHGREQDGRHKSEACVELIGKDRRSN
jgi:AAA domain/Domain of unknown function (DUF3854)